MIDFVFLGAGKILDELIDDEKKAGNWYYRDHAEYLIIKAASIELKGNIFHGLGLWYEAAASFMDSTGLFRSFQKPDKKGLAAGLALLADTLQFMPADDFKQFSRSFQLSTDHPLLESIRSVTEAAKYCVHTPLFYAKNKVSFELFFNENTTCRHLIRLETISPFSFPPALCGLNLNYW